jgi:hypothetical protein
MPDSAAKAVLLQLLTAALRRCATQNLPRENLLRQQSCSTQNLPRENLLRQQKLRHPKPAPRKPAVSGKGVPP